MATQPTPSMNISITADLSTYNSLGSLITTSALNKSLRLPVGGYNSGSNVITNSNGLVTLGTADAGFVMSSAPITVTAGSSTVVGTKLFSYDGAVSPIVISTTSTTPVTVEYVIGTKTLTVPDKPVITGVIPGDKSVSVAFTPPANGGSPITLYSVTSKPGGITKTGTTSPIQVTNLTNGVPYTFTIVAINAIGNSVASNASPSATPVLVSRVPGPPIGVEVSKINTSSANVYFIAPTNVGSTPITGYTVTSNPGNKTASGTASPIVITGLTPGTTYTFTVVATNTNGNSVPSVPSFPVAFVPSKPTAPTITGVTTTGTTANVQFTAPSSNGGSPITQYTVKSTPGNITASGTSSPITVNGLLPKTSYRFTMVATNSAGNSVNSNLSSSITTAPPPSTVPSAPIGLEAILTGDSVKIFFPYSRNNGGSPITEYIVSSTPAGLTASGTSSPITVPGIQYSTPYTFSIVARNAIGDSTPSPSSVVVTRTPANTVPGVPTITNVSLTNNVASIQFTPPMSNGGSPITEYTVTSSPSGLTGTGTSSPISVTGLTYGTPYTFTIKAKNSVGDSIASESSASVTPVEPALPENVPSAPRNLEAAKIDYQTVDVYFQAPLSTGGSEITSYTVTTTPGTNTASGTSSPIRLTVANPGLAYQFTVTAVNVNGAGAPATTAFALQMGD